MGVPVPVLRENESNVTINITDHSIKNICVLSLPPLQHCTSIEPGLYDAVWSFWLQHWYHVDPTNDSATPKWPSPTPKGPSPTFTCPLIPIRKYQYIGIISFI